MKKIKVVYIIVSAAPYGSNKALLNLLDCGISLGIDPLFITAEKGGFCEQLDEKGLPYHQFKYYYSIYPSLNSFRDFVFFIPILLRTLLYNLIATKRITKIAKEFDADLIHTNIGPLQIGCDVASRLNIPHIWHIREYHDMYFGWKALFSNKLLIRKLQNKPNYPIAITQGLYNHYNLKSNATVIYDGVLPKKKAQFIKKKEKYFLFVGRLEAEKGVSQLMEAFIEFAKNNSEYKLLIVGSGAKPYEKALKKIVDDYGMNHRVEFLGFRTDVNQLMAKATALVVSSTFEGFGFTTVEAMFNGCLIIGKNTAGTKEILSNCKCGIPYDDEKQLIAALDNVVIRGVESFFDDIMLAQAKALDVYSCEYSAKKTLGYYYEVLSPRDKG